MRSRWNLWGPGVSLSLAFSILTLSPVAQAQPDTAPAAPSEDDAAKGTAPGSDAAATTSPAADEQDKPAPAGEQVEPAQEPAVAPAGAPVPAKEAVSKDASESIAVKILPGSGYPEPRIRGIKGGSLWLTIAGYQWPYLPKVEGQSGLQLAISGSAWADTSYARQVSGTPDTQKSAKRWTNQSRAVLRATPTYSTAPGWFVQGNVEFVANGDQTVNANGNLGGVDDLFVRAGKWNLFDVTVGRMQGWEVYHYGMGLDQNTFERLGAARDNARPPQIYGLDFFWDRPNGGAGDYAAHFYPTDYLRFELLGQFGTRGGQNLYAGRGVGIFDIGYLKVKAGLEYGVAKGQEDEALDKTAWNGAGGAIQFVLDPHIEGGINGAVGYVDSTTAKGLPNQDFSTTTKSVGGFLNGRPIGALLVGLGANVTKFNTLTTNGIMGSPNFGKPDDKTNFQAFFAIQYSFWDRLFFKFVGSRATYKYEDLVHEPPHSFENGLWSARFRVMYLF
jgi:hypothetical protein